MIDINGQSVSLVMTPKFSLLTRRRIVALLGLLKIQIFAFKDRFTISHETSEGTKIIVLSFLPIFMLILYI